METLRPQLGLRVELTPHGFQIRHGDHGNLGGCVWAARWKAQKACEALAEGRSIPAEFACDRFIY